MKKKILSILITILALCTCLFTLTACDDKEPPHTHEYSTLKYDNLSHWYECDCGEGQEYSQHNFDEGRVVLTPTETTKGEKLFTCIICNETKIENIPTVGTNPSIPSEPQGPSNPSAPNICDVTFVIGKSKNSSRYSLTIKGSTENVVLDKQDFNDFEKHLEFSSDVVLSESDFNFYSEFVDTIIVDDVVKIESFDIISQLSMFSVYFSSELEYIYSNAFNFSPKIGTYVSSSRLALYFEGNHPELQSDQAFNFSDLFTSVVIYYNEDAIGFDNEYDLENRITYKKIGQQLYPTIELTQLANDFHNESIRFATEMFEECIEQDKVLPFLYPIASLDGYKKIKAFTLELTKDCTTETEKAKIIFNWVANNITYDLGALTFTCDEVFEEKRAVCAGYAFIMHDMLASVGIMSVYVHGLTNFFGMDFTSENVFTENGYSMDQQHAWNIAYIDGKAIAFDATWNAYDFKTPTVNGVLRIALDVEAFGVIPNGYSPKNFKTGLYEYDNNLYYFTEHGEITSTSTTLCFNEAYIIDTQINLRNDDLSYKGSKEIGINAIFRDGVVSYTSTGVPLFYILPNGKSILYTDLIKFIEYENQSSDNDFEIDESENFVTIDGIIYMKNGNEYYAYSCFSTLEEIIILSTVRNLPVTKIEFRCFYEITTLTKIVIPESVKIIDQQAFAGCYNLRIVEFHEGLTKILSEAFTGTGIEKLNLPNSLIEIDQLTFRDCPKLTDVTIGSSLSIFYGNSFYNCPSIKSYEIINNKKYKTKDGVIFDSTYSTLFAYPIGAQREKYSLPSSVVTIEAGAFSNCKILKEVVFNQGIKQINDYAFQFCTAIESLTLPNSLERVSQQTFMNLSSLKKVVIGGNLGIIPNSCFGLCEALEEIVILESVKQIENHAFIGCTNLKKIVIPKSVTVVGIETFFGCSSVETVEYAGSEADKKNIIINSGNDYLISANWIFKN